jgi:hypothetical protein
MSSFSVSWKPHIPLVLTGNRRESRFSANCNSRRTLWMGDGCRMLSASPAVLSSLLPTSITRLSPAHRQPLKDQHSYICHFIHLLLNINIETELHSRPAVDRKLRLRSGSPVCAAPCVGWADEVDLLQEACPPRLGSSFWILAVSFLLSPSLLEQDTSCSDRHSYLETPRSMSLWFSLTLYLQPL